MRPRDRLLTWLQSTLLSVFLGAGIGKCISSAYDLPFREPYFLLTGVAVWAIFCGICFSFRLGALPPVALASLGVLSWWKGSLSISTEAVVHFISDCLSKTYGFEKIRWSEENLSQADPGVFLLFVAAIVVLSVSWTVCRRKMAVWALGAILLPLSSCFLIINRAPSSESLFWVLFATILLILSQNLRRESAGKGNRLFFLAAIPTFFALCFMFLSLPQAGYVRQHSSQAVVNTMADQLSGILNPQSIIVGEAAQVDLRDAGPRNLSQSVVMELTTTQNGTLYLRGRSYDTYTGTGWRNGTPPSEPSWPQYGQISGDARMEITTRAILPLVYYPYYPQDVDMAAIGSGQENTEGSTQFSFHYRSHVFQARTTYISEEAREYFTSLPDSTAQWAQPLARSFALSSSDYPVDKSQLAERILYYVMRHGHYDLKTPAMPSTYDDFAQWFLEESDSGYCVHYATAATVLLRAAGIPARYVTGYMVSANAGGTTYVRKAHAHAWIECWLDGYGWMVLDATAPGSTEIPEQTDPTFPTEVPSTPTVRPTTPTPTDTGTEGTGTTDPHPGSPDTDAPVSPILWAALNLLVLLILLAGLILLQWQLRLQSRRQRMRTGPINRRILCAWQELAMLSRLSGVSIDDSLLELARQARFSNHVLTEEALSPFAGAIAKRVRVLRQQPLLKRLLHRFLYAAY